VSTCVRERHKHTWPLERPVWRAKICLSTSLGYLQKFKTFLLIKNLIFNIVINLASR